MRPSVHGDGDGLRYPEESLRWPSRGRRRPPGADSSSRRGLASAPPKGTRRRADDPVYLPRWTTTSTAAATGRSPRRPARPGLRRSPMPRDQPYLGRPTRTKARTRSRDDAEYYQVDRVCRATSYEMLNDGSPRRRVRTPSRRMAASRHCPSRGLIAHTCTYYDGETYVGLPFGHLGDYGAAAEPNRSRPTDAFLDEAYATRPRPTRGQSVPPYLRAGRRASWTAEYPTEFPGAAACARRLRALRRRRGPRRAGLLRRGWRAAPLRCARHRFPHRGLPVTSRDPLGTPAVIEYDRPTTCCPRR